MWGKKAHRTTLQGLGGLSRHPSHPLALPCGAGLYGERVGALSLVLSDKAAAGRALSQLKRIARALYSNPPVHGARIVSEVVGDEGMFEEWKQEMEAMAGRIKVGAGDTCLPVGSAPGCAHGQWQTSKLTSLLTSLQICLLANSCTPESVTDQELSRLRGARKAHTQQRSLSLCSSNSSGCQRLQACWLPSASGPLCLVPCRSSYGLPCCTAMQRSSPNRQPCVAPLTYSDCAGPAGGSQHAARPPAAPQPRQGLEFHSRTDRWAPAS